MGMMDHTCLTSPIMCAPVLLLYTACTQISMQRSPGKRRQLTITIRRYWGDAAHSLLSKQPLLGAEWSVTMNRQWDVTIWGWYNMIIISTINCWTSNPTTVRCAKLLQRPQFNLPNGWSMNMWMSSHQKLKCLHPNG